MLQFYNDIDEELFKLDTSSGVFASTTKKEIQGLLKKNKNRNTIKSMVMWVRRFEKWKKEKCISVDSPKFYLC